MLLPIVLIIGAIALWLTATPSGRAVFKGTFIYCIIMFPTRRLHLPATISSPIRLHEPILEMTGRTLRPDVYRMHTTSTQHRRPGVIVYAPLAPQGKRNKYVVNFLRGMARIGFVVLIPDWPERPLGLMDDGDVEELERSVAYLESQPDVDPKRIGIIAISYGAGPALIAASHTRLGNRLQYVMTIGGYIDLWSVMQFAGSGKVQIDAHHSLQLQPHPYMLFVLLRTLSHWSTDKRDRTIVDAFLKKITDRDTPIDASLAAPIDVSRLRTRLSKPVQAVFDALERAADGASKAELRTLVPELFRGKLDKLSLTKEMIRDIQSRVLIVHTTNDRLVPYSDALALYHLLPKKGDPILSKLSGFDHTIPPAATPANFFFIYAPNALKVIPLLYIFFRMQESDSSL